MSGNGTKKMVRKEA